MATPSPTPPPPPGVEAGKGQLRVSEAFIEMSSKSQMKETLKLMRLVVCLSISPVASGVSSTHCSTCPLMTQSTERKKTISLKHSASWRVELLGRADKRWLSS